MYSEVFPIRLKEARKITGFTQEEVAKELKINRGNLSRYETGDREPDIETLSKLAEFYGCTTDWLIGKGSYPGFEPVYKWDGLTTHITQFPSKLKIARNKKGLSQNKIANYIGVPQSNIAKYELGQLEPSIEILAKLSDYYQVSSDWLLGLAQ